MAKANAGQALKAAQARITSLEHAVGITSMQYQEATRKANAATQKFKECEEYHRTRNRNYLDMLDESRGECKAYRVSLANADLRIRRLQYKYVQSCLWGVAATAVLIIDIALTIWG